MGGQKKLHKAGQKLPGGAGAVKSSSQQGIYSKTQGGKTHSVKNRSVNHNRNK